jgi:hypothetical protein
MLLRPVRGYKAGIKILQKSCKSPLNRQKIAG